MQQAIDNGFTPVDHAHPGPAGDHGRRGLPGRARRRGLPARGRRPLPHRHLGGRARRLPLRGDPRPQRRPAPVRRVVGLLPARGRQLRQGHDRASSGCTSSTRSRCSAGAGREDAAAEHLRLLDFEEQMLAKVEIPYRVIDVAAGDLGGPAARKYDCEAWVPTQGRYRELTSTSNCTTYQARRLGVRERDPHRDGAEPDRRHPQRHAGHDPLDRRDPGEPPAGRRLGRRTEGVAALRRADVLDARCLRRAARPPRLVALDVDGTLVDLDSRMSAAVRDEVRRVARRPGRHVVVATGRELLRRAAGARPSSPCRPATRCAATAR